ncbi:MAG: TOBE domain-containing protein, partial [Prosthecobacter sp.]|nr:TOBE domain-containing protein [Prosthecobacter sp.]
SEALSLSDRVAVMNAGKVEQAGTPLELYESPASAFVRDFIGHTTRLPARVTGRTAGGEMQFSVGNSDIRLVSSQSRMNGDGIGITSLACIRPESVVFGDAMRPDEGNILEGTVKTLLFLGDRYECLLSIGGENVLAYAPRGITLDEGQPVRIQIPKEAVTLWPS